MKSSASNGELMETGDKCSQQEKIVSVIRAEKMYEHQKQKDK